MTLGVDFLESGIAGYIPGSLFGAGVVMPDKGAAVRAFTLGSTVGVDA